MSYTEMLTTPDPPERTYPNLTDEESGYFAALTFALAHWPISYQCKDFHQHASVECHYQYVLTVYNKLHLKEYGE